VPQIVRLRGITAEGRHGASTGERDEPQPFLVDLDIDVEARHDDLASTADYRVVVETVRNLVQSQSVRIIETLAERIATAVLAVPGVLRCKAVVHKPRATERLGADDVSAEAEAGQR
jgi:dihydroneopterin aldolase